MSCGCPVSGVPSMCQCLLWIRQRMTGHFESRTPTTTESYKTLTHAGSLSPQLQNSPGIDHFNTLVALYIRSTRTPSRRYLLHRQVIISLAALSYCTLNRTLIISFFSQTSDEWLPGKLLCDYKALYSRHPPDAAKHRLYALKSSASKSLNSAHLIKRLF